MLSEISQSQKDKYCMILLLKYKVEGKKSHDLPKSQFSHLQKGALESWNGRLN